MPLDLHLKEEKTPFLAVSPEPVWNARGWNLLCTARAVYLLLVVMARP